LEKTMTGTAVTPPRSGRRLTEWNREAIACALFIAPAVLGFIAFAMIPLIISGVISFTNYSLAGTPTFIGFENYRFLLTDKFWWNAVRVTATYAVVVVPLWLFNSLFLALLMNQNIRGVSAFRTIFYLPAVLSGVAVAMLWRWLLNYRVGLLNIILGYLGIDGPNWLGDKAWALSAIILMSQWAIGWYLPIWLGGLQSIPTELYEAVEIDGGGGWAKLINVTLPMLSPVILYNLVMNIIWATQLFTEPFILTGGGPQFSTTSYMMYLYSNAFSYMKMGLASAMGWILFIFVLLLTLTVFKSSPMWVYYEAERKNG
jgi:multiple sugar transport system permease protein